MAYVDLLANREDNSELRVFSERFFNLLGIKEFEERRSENYVGGYYYKANMAGVDVRSSLYDISDNGQEFFWVQFRNKNVSDEVISNTVDDIIKLKAIPNGMKFFRVLNLGKKTMETRIEY
jgi:hypothetical protein